MMNDGARKLRLGARAIELWLVETEKTLMKADSAEDFSFSGSDCIMQHSYTYTILNTCYNRYNHSYWYYDCAAFNVSVCA
jgi:hypothetical protein